MSKKSENSFTICCIENSMMNFNGKTLQHMNVFATTGEKFYRCKILVPIMDNSFLTYLLK